LPDIHVGGGLDLPEVNGEAVREHQGFTFAEVRSDFLLIQVALNMIRNAEH
jgi:hypothetical protein